MGLRCFLFDTTASQLLYTNFCSLEILQRQRRSRRGRSPVKLGALRRRSRGERAPLSWAPSAHAVAGEHGMILDLHIHTSWNSADSNLSPIELIHEAKRLGLDGVVVTEHDRGWNRFRAHELAAEHDFL